MIHFRPAPSFPHPQPFSPSPPRYVVVTALDFISQAGSRAALVRTLLGKTIAGVSASTLQTASHCSQPNSGSVPSRSLGGAALWRLNELLIAHTQHSASNILRQADVISASRPPFPMTPLSPHPPFPMTPLSPAPRHRLRVDDEQTTKLCHVTP